MLRIGKAPFLECSSKGDRRFSALFARLRSYGNETIENIYQREKIFSDGRTNLTFKEAKGQVAVNQEYLEIFYFNLWEIYFHENPELIDYLLQYEGFSDIFGQPGRNCQAVVIFNIVQRFKYNGTQ